MRLKIIAGNLIAVLVIGLVSFFVLKSKLEEGLSAEVDGQIANDATLLERSWRLSALQFVDQVSEQAATRTPREALEALGEDARRSRTHQAANGIAQWFRDPARGHAGPADLVALTDEMGRVVARNADPNRMHGQQLVQELPALRSVLADGAPRHDVWLRSDEDKVMQTGIAAIRSDAGAIIGALVVGYDISNGIAQAEAEVLGGDVAYVIVDRVYSSSLPAETAERLEEHLFGAQADQTRAALAGTRSAPWQADLAGDDYVGVIAPLPMAPSVEVAYVVIANRTEKMALASSANIILILTMLGVLMVLAYGFVIGTSFLRPVEQIEEGVLAVINGRTDLRLDVESAEFGGLAYRINQLINVFTGVSEEDDEGRSVSTAPRPGVGGWSEDSAFGEGSGGAGAGGGAAAAGAGEPIDDPQVAAQLAAEPEDAYYDRVHREYVAAKTAAGENVASIPQDRFVQRLKGNGSSLAKKHGCREVRFRVETRGSQVVLQPVLIR